jgi:hypothetical protein
MLAALSRLRLGDADDVVIVDNGASGNVTSALARAPWGTDREWSGDDGRLVVLEAGEERSPYYARNVGAERANGEWLLFTDADCRPSPTLLDDFFARRVDSEIGALAGGIRPAPDQTAIVARWATSRRRMDPARNLAGPGAAATANLLVRRSAWEELGGFLETVREGADFEFCWRLRDAGWRLELRSDAVIEHSHRESLGALLRQVSRDAAALAWLERRRPGSLRPPGIARGLATRALALALHGVRGRTEQAAMSAIDLAVLGAQALGGLRGNAAAGAPGHQPRIAACGGDRRLVLAAELFPRRDDATVLDELDALRKAGWRARVEALARPVAPRTGGARGVTVCYLEDEGLLQRLAASAWIVCRHPLRVASDLSGWGRREQSQRVPLSLVAPVARRLAAGGECHLHAESPGRAAAVSLRAGRLAEVPVSVGGDGSSLAELLARRAPEASARRR